MMTTMTEIPNTCLTYGPLMPERWDELTPIFEFFGVEPPDPRTAVMMCAFDEDDQLAGFLGLTPVMHFEPLWIRDDMRGKVSWMKLAQGLNNMLLENAKGTEVFVFASDEHIARMTELAGFTKLEGWSLYRKVVE